MPTRHVGIAGWSVPPHHRRESSEGSHLERYGRRFNAVEINSSFYRPHRRGTYERWASCVPEEFRFAVKIPKAITHEQRLLNAEPALERFIGEVTGLGAKLGALLVQLPPSLAFEAPAVSAFFSIITRVVECAIVCEPRHPSWFTSAAEQCLASYRVGRVAADPARVPEAFEPTVAIAPGRTNLVYFRLHGSPRMYYSSYDSRFLSDLTERLAQFVVHGCDAWCIFDNTAALAAWDNALELSRS